MGSYELKGKKACKPFSVREGLAAQVHALWFVRETLMIFRRPLMMAISSRWRCYTVLHHLATVKLTASVSVQLLVVVKFVAKIKFRIVV